MLWRIIQILFICAVIVLILMWLFAGGFSQIVRTVETIPNPIDILWGNSTSTYKIKFPWEIQSPRGPDISGLAAQGDALSGTSPDAPYSQDVSQETSVRNFGTPSQYRGQVSISGSAARESDSRLEYVELTSRSRSSISLSGWSLQSALTGTRVFLPAATEVFQSASINSVHPVTLAPGTRALVVSGPSPVGVSFEESKCTGYLEQTQQFEPALENACPASSDIAPLSAENIRNYGSQCMDYARSLPACSYPTSVPSWMTPGCSAYIANTFSYQGCVNRLAGGSDFLLPTWRLYLNSSVQFWDNTHDIIRLLDAQGQTVDALSY